MFDQAGTGRGQGQRALASLHKRERQGTLGSNLRGEWLDRSFVLMEVGGTGQNMKGPSLAFSTRVTTSRPTPHLPLIFYPASSWLSSGHLGLALWSCHSGALLSASIAYMHEDDSVQSSDLMM
jgi:hypothetical protein